MAMKKLQAVYNHLKTNLLEREDIIFGLLVALIARKNIVLIGPPGTAKSLLSAEMSRCITGINYFQWLLTRFSTPEELFGPVSLKALEQGIYQRNTHHKLPEAHLSFLDECFKANSAILNALLTLLNERLFYNNGHPIQCPLFCIVGASNEYPEQEEGLEALWSRFLLRYEVLPLSEDLNFSKMLTMGSIQQQPTITLQELQQIQATADAVQVNQDIIEGYVNLRKELASINIRPVDRTWRDSLSLVKAHAVMEGRVIADISDLQILKDVLWDEPGQKQDVAAIVRKFSVDTVTADIQDMLAEAKEIRKNALNEKTTEAGTESNKKFKLLIKALEELAVKHPAKASLANNAAQQVRDINKEVMSECLAI